MKYGFTYLRSSMSKQERLTEYRTRYTLVSNLLKDPETHPFDIEGLKAMKIKYRLALMKLGYSMLKKEPCVLCLYFRIIDPNVSQPFPSTVHYTPLDKLWVNMKRYEMLGKLLEECLYHPKDRRKAVRAKRSARNAMNKILGETAKDPAEVKPLFYIASPLVKNTYLDPIEGDPWFRELVEAPQGAAPESLPYQPVHTSTINKI